MSHRIYLAGGSLLVLLFVGIWMFFPSNAGNQNPLLYIPLFFGFLGGWWIFFTYFLKEKVAMIFCLAGAGAFFGICAALSPNLGTFIAKPGGFQQIQLFTLGFSGPVTSALFLLSIYVRLFIQLRKKSAAD